MTWRDLRTNVIVGVAIFLFNMLFMTWDVALRWAVGWLALYCAYDVIVSWTDP